MIDFDVGGFCGEVDSKVGDVVTTVMERWIGVGLGRGVLKVDLNLVFNPSPR